jgi:cobalamin biosynthesis Mg chelatase CobN
MAQSNTTNTQLPPSQQVDQSGKPEQTGRPDVDVDVGKNANNGVANVDVKRHGDSDTKAQGNTGNTGNTGTTGTTTTTTTGTYNGSTTGSTTGSMDNTTTGTSTGSTYGNGTNAGGDRSGLPNTASDMPLLGLIGALSLAGALGLRATR